MHTNTEKIVYTNQMVNINDMTDFDNLNLNIEKNNYSNDGDIIISLLLPTRDRKKWLDGFFKSLSKNTSDLKKIEVVIYIDHDDLDTLEYVNHEVTYTRIVGPVLAMGQYNSICYQFSSGRILILANDDVVIETNNWDKILINQTDKIKDEIYLAYPDDGYNHKKLSTFPVLSRKTCEALVYPYPPLYKRLYIDTHIMDVFQRLGPNSNKRILYLNEIKFTHHKLNHHLNDDNSHQRINHFDDCGFIFLRELRITQAARLTSIINDTALPPIQEKYVMDFDCQNFFSCCKYFYDNFICDTNLPLILRFKYFVRFTVHFFMIKTILGQSASKIINFYKKQLHNY